MTSHPLTPKQLPKFKNDEFYFVPLGGAGEIGMNMNLYCYNNQWIVVDLGITFNAGLGIEIVTPDPSFIEERRKNLLGLVLTHGHEDHIGAIPYLWEYLRCPIYATPFTMELIKGKLKEAGLLGEADLHTVPLESTITLGPFSLEFMSITHSIPEPNMIAIRTEKGTVLHTGDWKFDADPVLGSGYDTHRLKELGNEGVRALVCDSTNVFEPGTSGTELSAQEALEECIGQYPHSRIIISCFSSNVARLKSAAIVAQKHHRHIALAGRSLQKIDQAARKVGYLQNLPSFLSDSEGMSLPPEKVIFLCTGSQGENRAALYRIARGTHPTIKLEAGDVVIFSSRVIPGNEKDINCIQNLLAEQGVHILSTKDTEDIHVSGHPCQAELQELYACIPPEIAIPVHGEIRHLIKHAELAQQEWGTPLAIIPRNGDVIRLSGQPEIIGGVPKGRLGMDGDILVNLESNLLRDRRQLSENGAIFITLTLPSKEKGPYTVRISASGILQEEVESKESELKTLAHLLKQTLNQLKPLHNKEEDLLREAIRKSFRSHFRREYNKRPIIIIHIQKC